MCHHVHVLLEVPCVVKALASMQLPDHAGAQKLRQELFRVVP
jgi:hypothetical protein